MMEEKYECGYEGKCHCPKCCKKQKCCVDLILTILIVAFAFVLGLILGSVFALIVLISLPAVIAFAVTLLLLIVLRIIMLICCRKECC